jgi:hypothetical protein
LLVTHVPGASTHSPVAAAHVCVTTPVYSMGSTTWPPP